MMNFFSAARDRTFRFLFSRGDTDRRPSRSAVLARVTDAPADLLKRATALKKAGEMDAAIAALRQAYKAIAEDDVGYGTETFLRLPMYLQSAGRTGEAWEEFERLLANGYPGELRNPGLLPMHASAVYAKMALFLEREKRPLEAAKYHVLSDLCQLRGLVLQDRPADAARWISTRKERAVYLKRANRPDLELALAEFVSEESSDPLAFDLDRICSALDSLLDLNQA